MLKIALNLLSTFLMFVECERVFSFLKNLITALRNGLKEDIIEVYTFYGIRIKKKALSKPAITAGGCLFIMCRDMDRGYDNYLNSII